MKAAIEAERRATKEAAEREAAENLKKVNNVQVQETMVGSLTTKPVNSVGQPKGTTSDETFVSKSPGDFLYEYDNCFSVFVKKKMIYLKFMIIYFFFYSIWMFSCSFLFIQKVDNHMTFCVVLPTYLISGFHLIWNFLGQSHGR